MALGGIGDFSFDLEFHDAFGGAEAHPGHRIDDDAQPWPAFQIVRPAGRFAPPQVLDELAEVLALQGGLDFASQFPGAACGPLREQAGVHQAVFAFGVANGLMAKPVEQFCAVRRIENFLQRIVLAAELGAALGNHQQVEIMVAQDGDRRRSQGFDQAQCFQRFRPAIDQVTDQPQAIGARIKGADLEQSLQRVIAALDVANGVRGHGRGQPEKTVEIKIFPRLRYSTVTDLARLRGLSTSVPLTSAT